VSDVRDAIDAVWRIESPKLIGALARVTRDVGLAEDLAQDALVAALEQWPSEGLPNNPAAWLMAAAKHRAIDLFRRNTRLAQKHQELKRDFDARPDEAVSAFEASLDDDVGDDLLGLMFVSCHPVLAPEARVALTLRMVGGLTTPEIARAFLVSEPTIAQRIVRAKRALAKAHVRFELPRGAERAERLSSVLDVLYLIFNEGYAATAGDDWMRPELCEDALRIGRVLAGLAPDDSEVHGLIALMEIQASRAKARVTKSGEPILLLNQDRSMWDRLLIGRGLSALARAEQLAGNAPGPFTLQAAIAACHARALAAADTDWGRIASLYAVLARLTPSPVVELNRAVAVGMAAGPAAGLELVDRLMSEPALAQYHLLFSVRGDLLEKLGRPEESRAAFERAASLTSNARERALLMKRANEAIS